MFNYIQAYDCPFIFSLSAQKRPLRCMNDLISRCGKERACKTWHSALIISRNNETVNSIQKRWIWERHPHKGSDHAGWTSWQEIDRKRKGVTGNYRDRHEVTGNKKERYKMTADDGTRNKITNRGKNSRHGNCLFNSNY